MKKSIFAIAIWAALAPHAQAELTIVDYGYSHETTDTTTFSITFNQSLDLTHFDEYMRAAGNFQVYIYGDQTLDYPQNFSSIIRSAENPQSGDNVIVRQPYPESQDPDSGGWGAVTQVAPIHTDGNTISFTLNNAAIGYLPTSPLVYDIGAYEYGSTTSSVTNRPPEVPEPAMPLLWLMGAAGLAYIRRRRAS